MLKIRSEQLKAFQPQIEAAFVRRVAEYLKAKHPDAFVRLPNEQIATSIARLPDTLLRSMVESGIARARNEYGITWESALASFVTLMFTVSPNFDWHPLVERILKDKSIAPDLRLTKLWERTTAPNWIAVRQAYDATAWNVPKADQFAPPREAEPRK